MVAPPEMRGGLLQMEIKIFQFYKFLISRTISETMVKKLRYYARFIVVCLLLKKMKLVRDLVRELSKLIGEYFKTFCCLFFSFHHWYPSPILILWIFNPHCSRRIHQYLRAGRSIGVVAGAGGNKSFCRVWFLPQYYWWWQQQHCPLPQTGTSDDSPSREKSDHEPHSSTSHHVILLHYHHQIL